MLMLMLMHHHRGGCLEIVDVTSLTFLTFTLLGCRRPSEDKVVVCMKGAFYGKEVSRKSSWQEDKK
jgi:hypothetical protein